MWLVEQNGPPGDAIPIGVDWTEADIERWINTGVDPSGTATSPSVPMSQGAPQREQRRQEKARADRRAQRWLLAPPWPCDETAGPNAVAIVRGTWSEGHFAFEATVCSEDGTVGSPLHVSYLHLRSDLGTRFLKPRTDAWDNAQWEAIEEPNTAPVTADLLRTISTREILLAVQEEFAQAAAWRRAWAKAAGIVIDPGEEQRATRALHVIGAATPVRRKGRRPQYSDDFDQEFAERYLQVVKTTKRGVHRILADEWTDKLGREVSLGDVHNWLKRIGKKQILDFNGGLGVVGAKPGRNFKPSKKPKTRRPANRAARAPRPKKKGN